MVLPAFHSLTREDDDVLMLATEKLNSAMFARWLTARNSLITGDDRDYELMRHLTKLRDYELHASQWDGTPIAADARPTARFLAERAGR